MNSQSNITIRLAQVEDVPLIHRLLQELAATLGQPDAIKQGEQSLKQFGFGAQPRFETLLAFKGDQAVGLAVFFYEYSTWQGTPGAYVQDLYVSGPMRGTGLGRELLNAVREHSAGWGGRYLKLSVYDDNQQAISFYQHLGFELSDNEQTLLIRD